MDKNEIIEYIINNKNKSLRGMEKEINVGRAFLSKLCKENNIILDTDAPRGKPRGFFGF